MKLIIGLGNPGAEYQNTRHNFGFLAVDNLANDSFLPWKAQGKSQVSRGKIEGFDVLLVKPQTYMNNSGLAVQEIAAFYKIAPGDILVAHDELDLPFGTLRSKVGGSSAGHKGVQSIIDFLSSPDFARVRLGIDNETTQNIPADKFVLMTFTVEEKAALPKILDEAKAKIHEWLH
ncbi:MAG: aminoacyl-tRNA hydrolase [bacterium]